MKILTIVMSLVLLGNVAQADLVWDLRVGAKGTLTGNLWSEPDEALPGSEPLWGDAQFFVGGGGGLFVEVNFLGYVGLEVDFFYEANAFQFNETLNNFEYDYYTRFEQLRIPILVKGTLPLGNVELSLGIGPEFVVGVGADVELDYRTKLTPTQKEQADALLGPLYQAQTTDGTFLDTEIGINIKVWRLVIPISLRVGFNLSQAKNYDDRVDLTLVGYTPTEAKVKAIESYHFALVAGVGYLF